MHSGVPFYQLSMIFLALLVFISLFLIIWRHKPKTIEEKSLALFFLIFSGFFVLLPNHEYYLLPIFVPLFIFIVLFYRRENSWKKFKKIILIFLVISIIFLTVRPIYEVNWKEPVEFIKENYSNNVTIYSTSPKVIEYYYQEKVSLLHPNIIADISENNTIIMFTTYDKIDLENVKVMETIEGKFNILKSFQDKIFVYGSKNLI
jgi:D-alanyl-lipoteichoic acid acyltransferase DltB (MBOAT superfamily)